MIQHIHSEIKLTPSQAGGDVPFVGGSFKLYAMLKKPTAQIAHLVFVDTQANAEKPKELFFTKALC